MIKRVRFSQKDISELVAKVPPKAPADQVFDFSNVIVQKPWGNEYLLFRNNFVEVWHLFVASGEATSMHCHPNKKTGLLVLEGQVQFSTLNETLILLPLDAVIIDAGVFHSSKALSQDGAKLLEFETPPAKHDLIRLRDSYGRENLAYEGRQQMFEDGGQTIRFSETVIPGRIEKNLNSCTLSVMKLETEEFTSQDLEHLNSCELVVILEGLIYGHKNDEIYGVAEVLRKNDLLGANKLSRAFNLTVMTIKNPMLRKNSGRGGFFSKIIQSTNADF